LSTVKYYKYYKEGKRSIDNLLNGALNSYTVAINCRSVGSWPELQNCRSMPCSIFATPAHRSASLTSQKQRKKDGANDALQWRGCQRWHESGCDQLRWRIDSRHQPTDRLARFCLQLTPRLTNNTIYSFSS